MRENSFAAVRHKMRKRGINGVVAQSVLIFYLVLMLFFTLLPVIITVILSLKTEQDISTGSLWSLPSRIQWENYSSAIVEALPNMGITIFIALVSVVAMTLLSAFRRTSSCANASPAGTCCSTSSFCPCSCQASCL